MDNKIRTLVIDDLFGSKGVVVSNIKFDIDVCAVVKESNREYDIDSVEHNSVWVVADGTPLKLDEFYFKVTSTYDRLLKVIDEKIIEYAKNAPDHEWEVTEYDDV